jgi:hypothetical protein
MCEREAESMERGERTCGERKCGERTDSVQQRPVHVSARVKYDEGGGARRDRNMRSEQG